MKIIKKDLHINDELCYCKTIDNEQFWTKIIEIKDDKIKVESFDWQITKIVLENINDGYYLYRRARKRILKEILK